MRDFHWCDCGVSMIRCDDRGCRCTHCGGAEKPRYVKDRELDAKHPPPSVPDWMSRSYPYMSIATHFKMDYSVVLNAAGSKLKRAGWVQGAEEGNQRMKELCAAMDAADALHVYVQAVGMEVALRRLGQAMENV